MSDRDHPNNIEAEKSVIGSILIENAGYDRLSSQLETADFFRAVHRKIYECIGTLLSSGRPADLRLLVEELTRRNWLEDVGGPAYVASLVDGVPRATNIAHYAAVVKEKSVLRKLIKIGTKMVDDATAAQETARSIATATDLKLTALATAAKMSVGAEPLAKTLSALSEDLASRVSRSGQIIGLPTICEGLDNLTHGWQRSKMVVIAGDTSYGKSILALNTAHAIAATGARVVFYSFEMERQELEYRLVSSLSDVALTRILWGKLVDVEYRAVQDALDAMHELPIEINDSGARSIADIRSECKQIKAERGLGAIIIDHFQLMRGAEEGSRFEELEAASRGIKELSRELEVPIFVLSQLTIDPKDAQREPQLYDLRSCKSLGHDADLVLFTHPYKLAEVRSNTSIARMKLIMRKQRGGDLGSVKVHLERDFVRFKEHDWHEDERTAKPKDHAAPKPLRF